MGSEKFLPFQNNVIYNVYANCDEDSYTDLSSFPFKDGSKNKSTVNCIINIASPYSLYSSTGNIHVLGYGSRTYRKLSWGFKFDKKFLGRKSVKLRAMANDPTLIREKLSQEVYKSVGVPVQEGTYARLIINNDVYGLYLITDSFSSNWISNYIHGDNKASIGYSYQLFSTHPIGPYADFKYLGENYTLYKRVGSYKLDEYEKSEDDTTDTDDAAQWSPLVNFIKLYDNWVNRYGNDISDEAVDELKKFLNIESLLRLLVVDTLILAIDNFYLYQSNAALYYNPQRNNYQIIPYDFDQTLYGTKDAPSIDSEHFMEDCFTWVNFNDNEIFDHAFTKNILKHPQIKKRYDIILAKTASETFDKDKIHNFVHAIADLIRDDVAWNFDLINKLDIGYKNSEKYSYVNFYTLDNFEGNIDYESVGYDGKSHDDAEYGIQSFVDARGESCKAYTADVDTSDNSNISDDYDDVKVPNISKNTNTDKNTKAQANATSGSLSSYTSHFSFLFIFFQFVLFFLLQF